MRLRLMVVRVLLLLLLLRVRLRLGRGGVLLVLLRMLVLRRNSNRTRAIRIRRPIRRRRRPNDRPRGTRTPGPTRRRTRGQRPLALVPPRRDWHRGGHRRRRARRARAEHRPWGVPRVCLRLRCRVRRGVWVRAEVGGRVRGGRGGRRRSSAEEVHQPGMLLRLGEEEVRACELGRGGEHDARERRVLCDLFRGKRERQRVSV